MTTVLVVSALIRLTSGQSLMNLVVEEQTASFNQQAQDYYAANGSWNGFFQSYLQTTRQQLATLQTGEANQPPDGPPPAGRPTDGRIRGLARMVDT